MRGSVRKRGTTWEYNVDIGMAAAQRCQTCNGRVWIERKPKETCPKCGGELIETEERRRAITGGYATQKECQSALNKVLTGEITMEAADVWRDPWEGFSLSEPESEPEGKRSVA